MRIGIVNRFPEGTYLLGEELSSRGFEIICLELSALELTSSALLCDGVLVETDAVLWRVSENMWPACAPLGRALERVGPLVNPAATISLCADKLATSEALGESGVLVVPGHWVAPGAEVPDLGPMTVVKPVGGAGGRGVHFTTPGERIPADASEAWMAQGWAGDNREHLRVLVVGAHVVCAYRRIPPAGGLLNNVERGATRVDVQPGEEVVRVALAAAAATGALLAGVDLVADPWRVLEVNSCPGIPPGSVGQAAEALGALFDRM